MQTTFEFYGGPLDGHAAHSDNPPCELLLMRREVPFTPICVGAGIPAPTESRPVQHVYHLNRMSPGRSGYKYDGYR